MVAAGDDSNNRRSVRSGGFNLFLPHSPRVREIGHGERMGVGRKPDFTPLLAPGRHYLKLREFYERFVRGSKKEACREQLYLGLEELVQRFLRVKIPCEFWIDGSFLTEKEEPSDIDVSIFIDLDVREQLTPEQEDLIEKANDIGYINGVDSFVFVVYPRGHDLFHTELDEGHDWGRQYGLENSEFWLKGFVVMRLWETDVGLRICS
ncbi:DUF6932 family protein [Mesorhizobium sp. A556]